MKSKFQLFSNSILKVNKELREKLLSPFAVHINRKDHESNDRKVFKKKSARKFIQKKFDCFKMTSS